MDEESKPTDELDAMAVTILQSLGSTAAMGMVGFTLTLCLHAVVEAREDPKVLAYIEDSIKKTNEHAISRATTVQVLIGASM